MGKESRIENAHRLAQKHNSHIRYLKTYGENTFILSELFNVLDERNIDIYVVVPPFTPEYNETIYKEYKTYIINFLDTVPMKINFVDMNEAGFDSVRYFMDADHLNLRGAIEATRILDELLWEK